MNFHQPNSLLPHHRLLAYGVAVELLQAVLEVRISDSKLRDDAHRAAKGACLNCAEGAGRSTRADKARAFAIARGEAVEAIAAVEIAVLCGQGKGEALPKVVSLGNKLNAMLTKLIR
jgi:four helix bundle protein